jgi:hypothetical protein
MIELVCVAMLYVTHVLKVHLTGKQVGNAADFYFWVTHVIRPLELVGQLVELLPSPDDQLRLAKLRRKHLPTRGAL